MNENTESKKKVLPVIKTIADTIVLPFCLPVVYYFLCRCLYFDGGIMLENPGEGIILVDYVWNTPAYIGKAVYLAYAIFLVPVVTQVILFAVRKKKPTLIYIESFYALLVFLFVILVAMLRLHPYQG